MAVNSTIDDVFAVKAQFPAFMETVMGIQKFEKSPAFVINAYLATQARQFRDRVKADADYFNIIALKNCRPTSPHWLTDPLGWLFVNIDGIYCALRSGKALGSEDMQDLYDVAAAWEYPEVAVEVANLIFIEAVLKVGHAAEPADITALDRALDLLG